MSSRWERSTSFPSTPEGYQTLDSNDSLIEPELMAPDQDFLKRPAPANYVAGLGRGATGFVTQSDLGPARQGPTPEDIQAALKQRAEELGKGKPTAYINNSREKGKEKEIDEDDNDPYQDPDNEVGLFSKAPYDADDAEADRIWDMIEEKQTRHTRKRQAAREQREREERERKNPTISQQFAAEKRALASVTLEEWENIPEVGDLTGKNRRARENQRQRAYAVPDSVIGSASRSAQYGSTIADDEAAEPESEQVDFAEIGGARGKALRLRLDQAAKDAEYNGSATSVDPKQYLKELDIIEKRAQASESSEVKENRYLYENVVKSNPTYAPGWLALVNLEENAGRLGAAKKAVQKGCAHCPKSEDLWLANIRLHEGKNAKIVAAEALDKLPKSANLWMKKNVARRAIENNRTSIRIWKEAVSLEEHAEQASKLLTKAVQLIPLAVELWLALARMQKTAESAQQILNQARQAVPTSREIWIAAARLHEQTGGSFEKLNIMERAVKALSRENAMPKREEWIGEAERCEEEGDVLTCASIIRETLGWGLGENDDRKVVWEDDAKACIGRGSYATARAIYQFAVRVFPEDQSLWNAAVDLERVHGTKEALLKVLKQAVEACPKGEQFWLQYSKELSQSGEIDEARKVLGLAFDKNPGNENIWLAAVKLEADSNQIEQARELLATARQEAGTDRVWVKSVTFERRYGNNEDALRLVNDGLSRYPKAAKLWMSKGQIYEALKKLPQAREAYYAGYQACPHSAPLWILGARVNEKLGVVVRARGILDQARIKNPKSELLWLESVRLERRNGSIKNAQYIMAQALQQLPKSGLLWSENVWYLENRAQRKTRCLEAIRKVDNDPALFVTVARIFWSERRLEKAMTWFEKAIVADRDYGDGWAWYYKFLTLHGTEVSTPASSQKSALLTFPKEKRADVMSKCVSSEPKHGEVWQSISKDLDTPRDSTEEILKAAANAVE
ncbi:hypothetical protein N7468_010494 [Penicillium chermesinum]|uniref:PRP1 splicing factor N-terminal domain-containing protein n=1 Tax=Penicillium chermesinum TaxID=63820 RepID=A0A9W9N7S7_9EURO|nr:uncharacterized protein N7468_010494 [Penicillium chermesinum]KAJ5214815.1 hypothetical protein N7468_010494 [Penicillium chermesinum]